MESEKRTRATVNAEHTRQIEKVHERIDDVAKELGGLGKLVAVGVGILMTVQVLLKFLPVFK